MNPIRRNHDNDLPMWRPDGMLRRFFSDPFFWNDNFLDEHTGFSPNLNIEEKKDQYIIEAEVPGVEAENIDIEVSGNMLTLKGERRREETDKDDEGHMHRTESHYGSFQRSFTLPENANLEEITADSRHGILYIHVPKDESRGPRRIDIQDRNFKH